MDAAINGTPLEITEDSWSYEEICGQEYRVILNSSCFVYDEATGLYRDLRETDAGIRYLYDNALKLRVPGIIRPNENATATMLTGSIGYTKALTQYVISQSQQSDAIHAQQENPGIDVLTGLPFKEAGGKLTEAQKAAELRAYLESMNQRDGCQRSGSGGLCCQHER